VWLLVVWWRLLPITVQAESSLVPHKKGGAINSKRRIN